MSWGAINYLYKIAVCVKRIRLYDVLEMCMKSSFYLHRNEDLGILQNLKSVLQVEFPSPSNSTKEVTVTTSFEIEHS